MLVGPVMRRVPHGGRTARLRNSSIQTRKSNIQCQDMRVNMSDKHRTAARTQRWRRSREIATTSLWQFRATKAIIENPAAQHSNRAPTSQRLDIADAVLAQGYGPARCLTAPIARVESGRNSERRPLEFQSQWRRANSVMRQRYMPYKSLVRGPARRGQISAFIESGLDSK
jgi:hypothetical protein